MADPGGGAGRGGDGGRGGGPKPGRHGPPDGLGRAGGGPGGGEGPGPGGGRGMMGDQRMMGPGGGVAGRGGRGGAMAPPGRGMPGRGQPMQHMQQQNKMPQHMMAGAMGMGGGMGMHGGGELQGKDQPGQYDMPANAGGRMMPGGVPGKDGMPMNVNMGVGQSQPGYPMVGMQGGPAGRGMHPGQNPNAQRNMQMGPPGPGPGGPGGGPNPGMQQRPQQGGHQGNVFTTGGAPPGMMLPGGMPGNMGMWPPNMMGYPMGYPAMMQGRGMPQQMPPGGAPGPQGQGMDGGMAGGAPEQAQRPAPQPPAQREKKLLFTINKDTKEVENTAPPAAADKPPAEKSADAAAAPAQQPSSQTPQAKPADAPEPPAQPAEPSPPAKSASKPAPAPEPAPAEPAPAPQPPAKSAPEQPAAAAVGAAAEAAEEAKGNQKEKSEAVKTEEAVPPPAEPKEPPAEPPAEEAPAEKAEAAPAEEGPAEEGEPKKGVAEEKGAEAPQPQSESEPNVESAEEEKASEQSKAERPPPLAVRKEHAPAPPLLPGEKREYAIPFLLKFKERCKQAPPCIKEAENFLPGLGNNVGGANDGSGTPRGMQQGLLPRPGSGLMGTPRGGQGMQGVRGQTPRGGQGMQQVGRGQQGRGQQGRNQNLPPVEPLKRTENAYDISKTKPQSHTEQVLKEARGLLNKLTLTNFDKLSSDIAQLDIRGPEDLKGLVTIIFDKSLEESHFCNMYAQLCNAIKDRLKEFKEDTPDPDPPPGQPPSMTKKNVTFKRCLLNKCQEEFERADRYDELTDVENQGLSGEEKLAKTRRVRIRMLGNIKFIGELFAQKILNEKIMHECVKRLLASTDEDTIECLCKLMATIGKLLDRPEAKHYMDYYFDQMRQTAEAVGKQSGGNRLKFMLQDTIDLRKNRWVPRRETTGPKTIEEIRKEAAKEGIVAGPIPPPRGGPMMDTRGGAGGQRPPMQGERGGVGMRGGENRGQPVDRRGAGILGGGYEERGGARGGYGGDNRGGQQQQGGGRFGPGGGQGQGDYRSERFGSAGGAAPGAPAQQQQQQQGGGTGKGGLLQTPGGGEGGGAAAPAAKPKPTKEQMQKRVASTLEEYVELQDLGEVKATLEEMGSRECFSSVVSKALEMACDTPKHTASLTKLITDLKKGDVLNVKEIQEGYNEFVEFLEDSAIDVPASPKVAAEFVAGGLKDGVLTWELYGKMSDQFWKETGFHERMLGLVLNKMLEDKEGVEAAKKSWQEGGVSLSGLGVADENKWIEESGLHRLFPLPKAEAKMSAMLAEGATDDAVVAWIEAEFGTAVDRDLSRCIVRCVLRQLCADMGGAEALQKFESEKLIEPEEKAKLQQRQALMKKWLTKECDQSYALFEVQLCAQDMGFPPGFLSRMLATLYDLEVVEEPAVKDWLVPPDNRHPFLAAAKKKFSTKENVDAKRHAQKFMDWLESEGD